MELFDNAESAQAKNIKEYLDTVKKCLIIANDGNGIDGRAGLERAVCFYRDSEPSEKHGRYGIGLKHALIQFTQLMKKATIITCPEKPNYSEKKTIEENRDNRKLYQIEVDFPTIMKEEFLHFKAQCADRVAEKLWEQYAIDRYNTGTVIHIPCEDNVFSELLMMAQSTDIKTSLRYQLGITYQNYLKKNHTLTLQIDDTPVNIVRIERLFYEQVPKDDRIQAELTICRDSHRNIRVYVTRDKKQGYYTQSNPNVNRLKFVPEAPSDEWLPFGKMTLCATYVDDWIEKQRPSLEANGVVLPDNVSIQETRTILGGASIERNGKIVSIIPPTKETSGDTARYKFVEEQHWAFSYTPIHDNRWIENERIYTLDNLLGIEVNKSRIDHSQINKNIWMVYQTLLKQFAGELYKKKEPKQIFVPSTAASSVATPSSSVAAVAASPADSTPKKKTGPRIATQATQVAQVAQVAQAASSNNEVSTMTFQTVGSHLRSTSKSPKDIIELYKRIHNTYTDVDAMYRNASCVTQANLSTLYRALIDIEEVLKNAQ